MIKENKEKHKIKIYLLYYELKLIKEMMKYYQELIKNIMNYFLMKN